MTTTCSSHEASQRLWEAVVIGAGPAGSLAARQLAQSGTSVLLVDKSEFPRTKVCGCYINGCGLKTLSAVGLGELPEQLQGAAVNAVRFGTRHHSAEILLPPGMGVSRPTLDTALVAAAIKEGADFLQRTSATLGHARPECREVQLHDGRDENTCRAKVVVIACGVGGHVLPHDDNVQFKTAKSSLIGVGSVTAHLPKDYRAGAIQMAIGAAGYVGAMQVEDGRLQIAAALDPERLKGNNAGDVAQEIVDQSGLPQIQRLAELSWLGTAPLTKRPTSCAGERFFLVGDASGYVEPFTGEGMSWALAGGRAVTPFVLRGVENYSLQLIQEWNKRNRQLLGFRQRGCRWLTRGLRHPMLTSGAIAALARLPFLAKPFVDLVNRPL